MVFYGHAVGDNVMLSVPLRALRQQNKSKRIWVMTSFPELFLFNSDIDFVIPFSERYPRILRKLGCQVFQPLYTEMSEDQTRQTGVDMHIIAKMCEIVGIRGDVEIRPRFDHGLEVRKIEASRPRIVVQSSGMAAKHPVSSKHHK